MSLTQSIAVLMGGISAEHEVSLKTGFQVLSHLPSDKYSPFPILINKNNDWIFPKNPHVFDIESFDAEQILKNIPSDWEKIPFPHFHQFPKADFYFLALHGLGGEDGRLQGFLDLCNVPYSGSGYLGSAVGMDKISTKYRYQKLNLPTPEFLVYTKGQNLSDLVAPLNLIGWPLVLKDPYGGSSIGVEMVPDLETLSQKIHTTYAKCPSLLLEKFTKGTEGSCGYLENGPLLPPTEIIPPDNGFFDYESKYNQKTQEITPGRFSAEQTSTIQKLVKEAHHGLGLSIYSRTDFIISQGQIFLLETNTLPGLTQASLLPQAAKQAGLPFPQLLDFIIQSSLQVPRFR